MGRWPQGMPLFARLDTSNLAPDEVPVILTAVQGGIESWNAVCGVTLRLIRPDGPPAQLVVRFVADLAEDTSVPLDATQRQAWLNGTELGLTDEPAAGDPSAVLVMRLNPTPVGGWNALKLQDVAMHEAGHFLGFDHAPPGTPSCMSAYLNERITAQTPYDIATAQAVYGPPVTAQPATPPAVVSVPVPVPGASRMGVLATILARSVGPFLAALIAKVIHDQLQQGSTLNQAIQHAIDNIDTHVPANLRDDAHELLTALLALLEGRLDHALTAPPAAAAAVEAPPAA